MRALVAGDDPTAASLPPLCAEFAAKAKHGVRLGDIAGDEQLTIADEDRIAAGIFAFLLGEHAASSACWRPLPPAAHEDQFLDACQALQAAGHNPARSYASLFHAARAFPQAQALAIALIDAALAAGDLQEARQRLARLPTDADADTMLAARRRLLAADLLSAEGKPAEALVEYRALAQQTPGDPMPLLRLADVYLGVGDRDAARRVFQVVLRRWPNHGTAHLRLARMALQEHDVAGYLSRVRPLLARHQRGDNDVAADIAEVLRLGGLEDLEHQLPHGSAPRARGHDDAIPLSAWLRPDRIAAVRRGLELTATFDAAMLRLAEHEPRPAVAAILAGVETLLQLPQGNVLPTPTRVGLTALAPWLCRAIVRQDFLRMLPFARVLDDPIFSGEAVVVYSGPAYDPKLYYGCQVQTVGDCDGDTLDELCITAPATDGSTPGYLEFRSLPDGALLRTWREQDANRLFARAVAVLPDVDGDACRDLVVGRPLCSREPGLRALVELRSGRTGATLWSTSDPAPSFGAALATIGDVDGDGHDDIVAGVSPTTLRERGQVLLLSGRSGAVLRRIDADAAGHWFGGAVGNAGDLDGDGRDDVVVGGNYGAAPGVVCTYDAESGRLLTTFTESKTDQTFGHAVLGVGDLDGDGRGEIAIAAPAANTNDPGRVLVFSSRTLRPLYELRGERPRDVFGAVLCRLPSWFRNGPPALAVAARRGGPAGIGYVRIFDLQSGQPLQTSTASSAATFGVGLVDLGDRDRDGMRDLGAIVLNNRRQFQLWSQSYAQVLQGVKR
ncbi:MAG: FG-GAP repeat protein [Planctomycetes bacterium]|nr:FG-GAP repeat protein [Planctomycetota bacterium]